MRRSNRLAVAALAAGALVLAACGSDGADDAASSTSEATTTTVSATAEFSSELNDLCLEGKGTAGQASDDLSAALDAVGQAAQDRDQAAYAAALDQAETAVEGIIGAFDDFQTAVADLDVPAELQGALDDYLEAQNTQLALAQQLRDAIAADDGEAFNTALEGIQDADASTTEARTTAAAELDAPDCAPDDTTDSGASSTDATDDTATTETTAG